MRLFRIIKAIFFMVLCSFAYLFDGETRANWYYANLMRTVWKEQTKEPNHE